MMYLFRLGVFLMLIILGGIGMLMGAAVTLSAVRSGEITTTGTVQGRKTETVVRQSSEPDRYWQTLALLGIAPLVLGAVAAAFGWRGLKRADDSE